MFVFISLASQPKCLPPIKCGVSGWFAQTAQISSDVYLHARCCEIVTLWAEVLEKLWNINLPNVIVISRLQLCGLLKMGRPLCWHKTWCWLEVLHKWHSKDDLTVLIVISQMFVCRSLSQRAVFSNPWNCTPGLQQDGMIVAGILLRNRSHGVGYSSFARSFSIIVFLLKNVSLAASLALPAAGKALLA